MQLKISKNKIKNASIFIGLTVIVGAILYYFNPLPVYEWTYEGERFVFREDLKAANNVVVSPDCKTIYNTFNNPYISNVTVYFKNDPVDFDYFQVEAVELRYKITRYSSIDTPEKLIWYDRIYTSAAQWNLEEYPIGSPSHPRIYLIGPTSAKENSVRMDNFTVVVQGRTLKELDYATIKAMMCIFGTKI